MRATALLLSLLPLGCGAFDCAEWTEPDPGPAPAPAPRPLDALPRIDLARDTLEGEWAVENGGLVVRRAPAALRLPGGSSYTLVLAADRPLFTRLTAGGRSVRVELTADRPRTLEWSPEAEPVLDGRPAPLHPGGPGVPVLWASAPGLVVRRLTLSGL
ncbi:MAG TPA: hypothetical protein VEJ18_07885 [Planctomycetota bacterium]|nr:hypothetical protein [Planctomycetota bacterium]